MMNMLSLCWDPSIPASVSHTRSKNHEKWQPSSRSRLTILCRMNSFCVKEMEKKGGMDEKRTTQQIIPLRKRRSRLEGDIIFFFSSLVLSHHSSFALISMPSQLRGRVRQRDEGKKKELEKNNNRYPSLFRATFSSRVTSVFSLFLRKKNEDASLSFYC